MPILHPQRRIDLFSQVLGSHTYTCKQLSHVVGTVKTTVEKLMVCEVGVAQGRVTDPNVRGQDLVLKHLKFGDEKRKVEAWFKTAAKGSTAYIARDLQPLSPLPPTANGCRTGTRTRFLGLAYSTRLLDRSG